MDSLEYIKNKIEHIYKTNPNIHVSMKLTHSRIIEEETPGVITGVYRKLFQVESICNGYITSRTYQYSDVLIGRVVIKELDYEPKIIASKKK